MTAGQLFVPVVADRDGHEFVAHAVETGAVAYFTTNGSLGVSATGIDVDDTVGRSAPRSARARSACRDGWRSCGGHHRFGGKTSVKDLTSAALAERWRVHASPRSFNNELGVPLTLTNAPDDADAVVIEMGARGLRHVADLCDIARPTVGVVTAVALAHAEMFGTIEDVAVAKGELVEALPEDGTAVLNADDVLVAAMRSRAQANVLTFGVESHPVDVTASGVTIDDHLRPSLSPGIAVGTRAHRASGARRASSDERAGRGVGRTGVRRRRRSRGLGTARRPAVSLADGVAPRAERRRDPQTTRTTPTRPRWRPRCERSRRWTRRVVSQSWA